MNADGRRLVVLKSFLIAGAEHLDLNVDTSGIDARVAAIVDECAAALTSVVTTASVPFVLTCSAVQQRRHQQLAIAERIRLQANPISGDADEAAARRAEEKLLEFVASANGVAWLRDTVINDLNRSLRSDEVREAAVQLLLQGLVATWTSFEVFCGHLLRTLLDLQPGRAVSLLDSEHGRKVFGKAPIDVSALATYGFNV